MCLFQGLPAELQCSFRKALMLLPLIRRTNFSPIIFNKEKDWGKEVVASYNDGFKTNCEVKQYERGGPAAITNHWLTDDAISSSTWNCTSGMSCEYCLAGIQQSFPFCVHNNAEFRRFAQTHCSSMSSVHRSFLQYHFRSSLMPQFAIA
jgi:hypothetical protein